MSGSLSFVLSWIPNQLTCCFKEFVSSNTKTAVWSKSTMPQGPLAKRGTPQMQNPMSEKSHYYGYKALPLSRRTPVQIRAWSQEQKTEFLLVPEIRASQESQPSIKGLTASKNKRLGENSTQTSQALFQNAISQSIKMLCKQKSDFPSTPHLLINKTLGVDMSLSHFSFD